MTIIPRHILSVSVLPTRLVLLLHLSHWGNAGLESAAARKEIGIGRLGGLVEFVHGNVNVGGVSGIFDERTAGSVLHVLG